MPTLQIISYPIPSATPLAGFGFDERPQHELSANADFSTGSMIKIGGMAKPVASSVVDMIQSTATLCLGIGMNGCVSPLWLFLTAANIYKI